MNSFTRTPWLVGIVLLSAALAACGSAQSRKQGYIAHGKQYLAAGNYDKARVEFSNAAQIDPKDASVRYLLGQVAEHQGDERAAAGQYQAAIEQDPANAQARAALARIYLYAGRPDKAMELAEPGLSKDPNNAQLLTVRGGARAQLGDFKSALQDAQRAVQLAPGDDYAIALLASLYRQRSEYGEAISVVQAGLHRLPKNVDLRVILADLDVARKDPADAESVLRQIIALQPKVLVNRYRLARFYLQQKNVDAAERTLRDSVQSFPASTDAKVQLVQFIAAQRGHAQAVQQADLLISQEPNNDVLRLAIGQFLAQSGEAGQAEQDFRAVVAHAREDSQASVAARDRLAELLLRKGDRSGASEQIAEVLRHNPRDNDALILRSNVSMAHGDVTGAINDLRAVLRDQPNAVPVMRVLAGAYQQNGEMGLAEETLRTAVQVSPKDPESRLDLAQILIGANKPDQAEPLLEQLAKEQPSSLLIEQTLFRAQAAQKLYDQARQTAQNLQHLNPRQGLGFYLEGLIDETQQNKDAAARDYEQALRLEPNANEPLGALTRLDMAAHQPQAALNRINDVLVKAPNNPAALILKAEVLLAEGQTELAEDAYQKTIDAAPTWERGYDGQAMAQLRLGRNDDAVRTLQLGLTRAPGNRSLLTDLAGVYERLGRPEQAIALYQGLLGKDPGSVFAANNLAMLLVTYRHDAASLALAQKLADQLSATSVPTVMDTRGWVKFKSGDFHAAESLLQEAVDRSPGAPELRYHLAMAQLRSGESQAAQQNLQSALQSPQTFAGMDDARAVLAQLRKGSSSG